MNGYLMYKDNRNYVGMYHALLNLQALIKEAIYFNRIPVIVPPLLHSKHNFDIKRSSNWSKYLNISQTEVYVKDNGDFNRLSKVLSFIVEEEFQQLKFDEGHVYIINPYHEITDAENKNYQVIVRSVSSIFWGRWWHAIPKINKKMRINLNWSDDVIKISKKVIDSLGRYSAIHVRRGDRLKNNKNLKKFTSPKHIFKTVKEIVPLQSSVYILTNEKDKKFFDYLRMYYKIYQYFDFDELTAIISDPEPDNDFLFLIERCIYENASIKIGTFKSPKTGFWNGGDYSLSKYTRVRYSASYKLRNYMALMASFLKSLRKRPISFKSKYNKLRILTREFLRDYKPKNS